LTAGGAKAPVLLAARLCFSGTSGKGVGFTVLFGRTRLSQIRKKIAEPAFPKRVGIGT
jgi:hypothetical protein